PRCLHNSKGQGDPPSCASVSTSAPGRHGGGRGGALARAEGSALARDGARSTIGMHPPSSLVYRPLDLDGVFGIRSFKGLALTLGRSGGYYRLADAEPQRNHRDKGDLHEERPRSAEALVQPR